MKTFTDNAGRNWNIAIHVDAIRRVRAALDVNLTEVVNGHILERLVNDPILLVDILYVLCREQADAAGVSDAEFGRGLAGEAIDAAVAAFLDELASFFPRRQRTLLQHALQKLQQLEGLIVDRGVALLDGDAIDRKMIAALDAAVAPKTV